MLRGVEPGMHCADVAEEIHANNTADGCRTGANLKCERITLQHHQGRCK